MGRNVDFRVSYVMQRNGNGGREADCPVIFFPRSRFWFCKP